MSVTRIKELVAEAIADNRITRAETDQLIEEAQPGGVNAEERVELRFTVARYRSQFESGALSSFTTFLGELPESRSQLERRFDLIDEMGPGEGSWYSDGPNGPNGLLAWGTSYVMESYLEMYQSTGETRYLDRLCWMVDRVLKQRDRERGVTDFRGDSGGAWLSDAGGFGSKDQVYAVHTGMIATPMVELAVLLKRNPELADHVTYDGETLADKAEVYVQAGEDAAAVHDREWRNEGSDSGYYFFPSDGGVHRGRTLPLNQMNTMGMLHLALAEATGSQHHADRGERLATNLKRALTVSGEDAYLWNYWNEGRFMAPGEDVSHAAINVAFAKRAYEAGVVFDRRDMERFARTVTRHIHKGGASTASHIGGPASNDKSQRYQLGRWASLSEFDPEVYPIIRRVMAEMDATSGSILLAIAYLAGAAE
jgi:hypothetical protein